jgi:hypothetical protein
VAKRTAQSVSIVVAVPTPYNGEVPCDPHLPAFAFTLQAAQPIRPNLQWYKTISGSAPSATVSVASDSFGDLYVGGYTYALDLPTAKPAQGSPGGSPITVIAPSAGAAQKITNPAIAGIATLTAGSGNPQALYATSNANLLRSLDAGATWIILPTPADGNIVGVTTDPTNSATLYLASSTLGALKSPDGGVTWQAINNGIPVTSNQGADIYHHLARITTIDVFRIWIDPKAPSNLIEYGSAGVYRTANGGPPGRLRLLVSEAASPTIHLLLA